MPRGTGRPDNRDEREARASSRSDRSDATRSKQADLQSFGATPLGSEPDAASIDALSRAIDQHTGRTTGVGGFMNDLFGMKNTVQRNPRTGQWDVHVAKEISPFGMVASAIGGPAVGAAVAALDLLGVDDPLSFEVNLGFVSETQPPKTKNDQRSEREFASPDLSERGKRMANKIEEDSAIDKVVKDLLESQDMKFFEMPKFALLPGNFDEEQKKKQSSVAKVLETEL